jgi:hypothetical protein
MATPPVRPGKAKTLRLEISRPVPTREDESDWSDALASNSHPKAGLLARENFRSPSHRKIRQWHADRKQCIPLQRRVRVGFSPTSQRLKVLPKLYRDVTERQEIDPLSYPTFRRLRLGLPENALVSTMPFHNTADRPLLQELACDGFAVLFCF